MKKKITAIAVAVCLVVLALAGASLAFFSDYDDAVNVFTSGKVDITLNEVFDQANAKLIPGVDIEKSVTISLSADSVESYVWYTFAIPAAVDNGAGTATLNVIHVNHAGRNLLSHRDDPSYWEAGQSAATPEGQCWILQDTPTDTITVDGILYNVYTVLYNGSLKAGETTTVGMTKVYCDTKVDFDNESGKYTILGEEIPFDLNNVKIIVTAYGIQAATFGTVQEACAAYNAQMAEIPTNTIDID